MLVRLPRAPWRGGQRSRGAVGRRRLACTVAPPAWAPLADTLTAAAQQRLGLRAAMGLDHADHDILAGLEPGMRALQHLVGLADAGRGADENPELARAPFLLPRRFQQRFRRGPMVVPGIVHA